MYVSTVLNLDGIIRGVGLGVNDETKEAKRPFRAQRRVIAEPPCRLLPRRDVGVRYQSRAARAAT
jgi:hypothetical protein